ncbi:MAG: hypothetical protein E7488_06890 [Ruminococcaceae bacterium]|nr:hypothetical protein [Oscillospiraceae bacterium]
MNSKILYVVDSLLNQYNSVRDILYNIITLDDFSDFEHIIAKAGGHLCFPLDEDYIQDYKTYSAKPATIPQILKSSRYNLFTKIRYCCKGVLLKLAQTFLMGKRYYLYESYNYLKTVIRKENPDVVIFFNSKPNHNKLYTEACIRTNTPYITLLYDTYIDRPSLNIEEVKLYEGNVIDHSEGYFIPSFFFSSYLEHYKPEKLISYNLPLLIDRQDVLNAYKNCKNNYGFTYFGQMQSFRNSDKVKDIFRSLNITMDIFTTDNHKDDDIFHFHPAVTKDELYNIVAGSRYLVALDNSIPFNWYLPSKAYLYVSFTKPIIAFGDNEESALKNFFKDYPHFYYQNINEPLDGLREFLQKEHINSFDDNIYSDYLQFSPAQALEPLVKLINRIV